MLEKDRISINYWEEKTVTTLREEGIAAVAKKAKNLVQMSMIEGRDAKNKVFRDVLFINGCDESVPHPARYSRFMLG